jgi:general nucleoside transport system permease protein
VNTARGRRSDLLLGLAAPVSAFVIALLIASVVLIISGSNPLDAWGNMWEFGTRLETTVDALNRAVPLYIAGIAVALGFRMNLFNIGVEGQYILAALIATKVGAEIDLFGPLHVAVIVLVAMAVGAAWAAIPAILKATRGVNEVIASIMLNAIGVSFVAAELLGRWDSAGQDTRTADIGDSGRVPGINWLLEIFTRDIGKGRELYGFLFVAVAIGIGYHILLTRTVFGYDLRASGANPTAAEASGVPSKRMVLTAMIASGAIAGLIGLPDILGDLYHYGGDFSQGLGFLGIAVALLGRNHPGGIVAAALIFGYLDASSPILEVEGDAPREIVTIMKGVIIFAAVVAYAVAERTRRLRQVAAAAEAAHAMAAAPADDTTGEASGSGASDASDGSDRSADTGIGNDRSGT